MIIIYLLLTISKGKMKQYNTLFAHLAAVTNCLTRFTLLSIIFNAKEGMQYHENDSMIEVMKNTVNIHLNEKWSFKHLL
jgi:hypothetical protein